VTVVGTTDDRNDPGLKRVGPDGMQDTYLVLSEEERAKGFVRPVRRRYVHVGPPGPKVTRDLTPEEAERYSDFDYVKFEPYENGGPVIGRYWTRAQLDHVNKGCGQVTTMGLAIAETYARNPTFYTGTFCVQCGEHFPVGEFGEFVWDGTDERVGT
jgi:hypothetical protein